MPRLLFAFLSFFLLTLPAFSQDRSIAPFGLMKSTLKDAWEVTSTALKVASAVLVAADHAGDLAATVVSDFPPDFEKEISVSSSPSRDKTAKGFARKDKKQIKKTFAHARAGKTTVSKRFNKPYKTKSLYDRPEVEVFSGKAVTSAKAIRDWNKFLGKKQTGINPHTGKPDPNRIWSANGKRSVRFGAHEMNSSPKNLHYHKET